MRRLKHFGCTERFLFSPINSCGFSLPDSRFCGNDELKIILRSRDWIPAFAGMTAAGCCFLFINFCNFEFQPSSINHRNVSIVIPAQAGIRFFEFRSFLIHSHHFSLPDSRFCGNDGRGGAVFPIGFKYNQTNPAALVLCLRARRFRRRRK